MSEPETPPSERTPAAPREPAGEPAGDPASDPATQAAERVSASERAEVLSIARRLSEFIPFNHALGFEAILVEAGHVRFRVPYRPEYIGDPIRGALHGGLIATLIDAAGGAAAWTQVRLSDRVSTIDMRVDYLRPGKPEALIADAHVVRAGRHVSVVSVRTYHDSAPDKTIAEGRGVYSIRSAPPEGGARGGAGTLP